MKRVRYIMRSAVQRASAPGNVETFSGEIGETAELPDELAVMWLADGHVELLAAVHKPTAETPRPAKRQK